MLKLNVAGNAPLSAVTFKGKKFLRVTRNSEYPFALRSSSCLLLDGPPDSAQQAGYGAYLSLSRGHVDHDVHQNVFNIASELAYLDEGDVIRLTEKGDLSVIYRRKANMNAFLVTERCNSFCVMCSQPPRDVDDGYLVSEYIKALPLIGRDAREIGITGGEPTLAGDKFFDLVQAIKSYLPDTSLHILSNGRNFKDRDLAGRLASIRHHDVMVGIPLYSDVSSIHDFVVQADGAYDETIAGILNLKRFRIPVEIRVVVHKYTHERLLNLANFIARNLQFVDHVALMGLEPMGFGKTNFEHLWVDPLQYGQRMTEAAAALSRAGIRTSIYNHQLCVIPEAARQYAVKSISDWKAEYIGECEGCALREKCGGFFSSAVEKHSVGIRAFSS